MHTSYLDARSLATFIRLKIEEGPRVSSETNRCFESVEAQQLPGRVKSSVLSLLYCSHQFLSVLDFVMNPIDMENDQL